MSISSALLAVRVSDAPAVFEHYALHRGQPVAEIEPGQDLDEPLRSMMKDMGAVYSPPIGYGVSGERGVFCINLSKFDLFQEPDANAISMIAPVWMLVVYAESGVATLSLHVEGETIYRLEGASDDGVTELGHPQFELDELIVQTQARAAELRLINGDDHEAGADDVPQFAFETLTGGVTYAGAFVEQIHEVHGSLPMVDVR